MNKLHKLKADEGIILLASDTWIGETEFAKMPIWIRRTTLLPILYCYGKLSWYGQRPPKVDEWSISHLSVLHSASRLHLDNRTSCELVLKHSGTHVQMDRRRIDGGEETN